MRPDFASAASAPPHPLRRCNPMNEQGLPQSLKCLRSSANDIGARARARTLARAHALHVLLLEAFEAVRQWLLSQGLAMPQASAPREAARGRRVGLRRHRGRARVLPGNAPCGYAEARCFSRGAGSRISSQRRAVDPVSRLPRGVKLNLELLQVLATWPAPTLHEPAITAARPAASMASWRSRS